MKKYKRVVFFEIGIESNSRKKMKKSTWKAIIKETSEERLNREIQPICEHRGTDGPRPAKNPSVRQTFPFSRPDCPAHIWLLCTHLHTL